MDRHPLVFFAIVVTLGLIQGASLGLLIVTERTLDKLVEVTRTVANNLADLIEQNEGK